MRFNRSLLMFLCLSSIPASLLAGAWGYSSFENDDAMDWISEFFDAKGGVAMLNKPFDAVIGTKGYLESPACCEAIAAAEVVAALAGHPSQKLPDEVVAFAAKHKGEATDNLRDHARAAIARVLEKSELRDLWSETPDFEKWKSSVEELRKRL